MKKLGLIGGVGPASTLDYYKNVIDGWRENGGAPAYPEFTVENVDMTMMLSFLSDNNYDALAAFLAERITRLASSGAEFAAIASNTPHIVYDRLIKLSPLPVLSIVDATCNYAKAENLKKILVLGTKFTMESGLYDKALSACGIKAVLPTAEDVNVVHGCIFPKLEDGIVDAEDKKKLINLIEKYAKYEKIDAVLLGCTELPLMIKASDLPTLSVLDTTAIHCKAIVAEMLK